jgi:Skp family chaperone for outer membrane proteins
MHSKFALLAALAAGLLPIAAVAQDAPAAPMAAPSAAAEPAAAAVHAAPQAYPAKIALIAFQQAVMATNEGRATMASVQTKYEPKQTALEALNTEVENLKKELQTPPAGTTDAERATRMKSLDAKQKQMDEQTQEARTAYQADLQEAYAKVAEKVHKTLLDYVTANGYTILFDVSNDQSPVVWAQASPSADITLAVIDAYNKSSGVAAPEPDAPAAPAAAKRMPASRGATKPATK